jgi:molecular chaperone DnaK
MIYTAEKSLVDHGAKVGDDIKKEVQEKIDALKKVKDGTDKPAVKSATEDLSRAMSKIGEAISKQASDSTDTEKKDEEEGPKVRDAETDGK